MVTLEDQLATLAIADGKPMSDERLGEVFGLVKPEPNWKAPIDMLVVKDKATVSELRTAVVWYCGGYPEVADYDSDFWKVTGAGYYEWVGA